MLPLVMKQVASRLRSLALGLALLGLAGPAGAAFIGHGGPVKDLAIAADGGRMVSVGFDYSVIVWRLADGAAEDVRYGHEAAVNAVVLLPTDGFVTAGDDGAILVWEAATPSPRLRLGGHEGRIVDLDLAGDERLLASAGWDGTVRLWDLTDGREVQRLAGHQGVVNAVRFTPDGTRVVSAGADGTLRVWRVVDGTQESQFGGGPDAANALALAPDGRRAYVASAAGQVRIVDMTTGGTAGSFTTEPPMPLVALALSPDGGLLAATGMDGTIALWDTDTGALREFLGGERRPLWSLAFSPDGQRLYAGGHDRTIRQWSVPDGEEIDEPVPLPPSEVADLAAEVDDEGAVVWRRCQACHTLEPNSANRAGPTLFNIFGRPIGTIAGYPYSQALQESDIVWTEETVSDLFRRGPDVVTPGTKMPVQRITDEAELAALMAFLRREAMPD